MLRVWLTVLALIFAILVAVSVTAPATETLSDFVQGQEVVSNNSQYNDSVTHVKDTAYQYGPLFMIGGLILWGFAAIFWRERHVGGL